MPKTSQEGFPFAFNKSYDKTFSFKAENVKYLQPEWNDCKLTKNNDKKLNAMKFFNSVFLKPNRRFMFI